MFHDLSSDTISKIINVMELRTFEMSQNLVTQGDDASEFMVIMKGAATVYHDGNQVRNFLCFSHFFQNIQEALDRDLNGTKP